MNPILHIGYQKTATSWLQREVLPRHPELAPVLHYEPGGEWIEESVGAHPFTFDARALRAAHEAALTAGAGRRPFVSYEAWVGDPYTGARNTLQNAQRLHALFPRARVVVVVREPLDMLASMYRQFVQEGGALGLAQLLARRYPERIHFDPAFLFYDDLVDVYARLFGRERVLVLTFEALRADRRAFLDALFAFCGVAPLELDGHAGSANDNRGLSPASLRVQRFSNRFLRSAFNPAPLVPSRLLTYAGVRRVLQRGVDPRLFGGARPGAALPAALRAELRELYRPHNARLAREHGVPVREQGYDV
jgi:hypothetical protein